MKKVLIGILLFIFAVFLLNRLSNIGRYDPANNIQLSPAKKVAILGQMIIRDWSPDGKRLLGDKEDTAGVNQVYTWDTDGSDEQLLTNGSIPGSATNCHKGFPHYHPSGRYIVMTVEMNFNCPKKNSIPGQAANTNLYIYDLVSKQWTNITAYPHPKEITQLNGALSPYFSEDGTKLVWSKITKAANYFNKREIFGTWEIHVADFSTSGGVPYIYNDTVIQAGNGNLYEVHGFSPDGEKILFSSDINLEYSAGLDVFTYDLTTKKLTNLTNSPDYYDEHARFSPDGKFIIWGSSMCCTSYNKKRFLKTLISETFIMNSDGTNKAQVTRFHTKHAPEYYDKRTGRWPTTWSPDGTQFIVAQQNYDTQPPKSWLVTLETDK